ncbi:MAG: Gfo/Idh/MocA family oxidoreductase [Acidobacteriaceae bacterium]|nr:Gfo/Idh/MocA family oxidoreductase [Acidobacteriaceae bacterium]
MKKLRAAVIGVGSFGRHHVRAISEMADVELAGVFDLDPNKAAQHGSRRFGSLEEVCAAADCGVVATPTITHEGVASQLIEAGLDVLVEKPIADSSAAGERLARLARQHGRILQVGHLERFNPAILAVEKVLTIPLFFEIHRLSVFTPRSLDIDVVLDLMIHDLDIVLSFTREMPVDIQAAGISVLSPLVDIANVRLSFASGCVANLTASRVSTEKVRKLRLFQPGEYISVDYQRQDAIRLAVLRNEANAGSDQPSAFSPQLNLRNEPNAKSFQRSAFSDQPADGKTVCPTPDFAKRTQSGSGIEFESLPVAKAEPLKLELEAFFGAVRARSQPRVDAFQATNALRVAEAILAKIKEHGELVAETIRRAGQPS